MRSRKRAKRKASPIDKTVGVIGITILVLVVIAKAIGPWTNILITRYSTARLFWAALLAAIFVYFATTSIWYMVSKRRKQRSGVTFHGSRSLPPGAGSAGSGPAGFGHDSRDGGSFGGGGSSGSW